jgi:hypothetical protein
LLLALQWDCKVAKAIIFANWRDAPQNEVSHTCCARHTGYQIRIFPKIFLWMALEGRHFIVVICQYLIEGAVSLEVGGRLINLDLWCAHAVNRLASQRLYRATFCTATLSLVMKGPPLLHPSRFDASCVHIWSSPDVLSSLTYFQ